MADYPEALESDPDGVSTALEVGATFWLRGDFSDAVKWLRKAVDAAFDEGADERGLELSKAAAVLATTVPTTPAPPPPTSVPAPVRPTPPSESPPQVVEPERAPEMVPPARSVAAPAVEEPKEAPEASQAAMSASGLPLPRVSARPVRAAEPTVKSATRTHHGVGGTGEPSLLTPFALVSAQRIATPPRAAEAAPVTRAKPEAPAPTPDPTAQEVNERSPTRPLDEPSVEELVNSAFPDEAPPSVPAPEPTKPVAPARSRHSLWNATDALRVAVSRDGRRLVLRPFDGAELRAGEVEAVMIGLNGGPELADLLQAFEDNEASSAENG